MKQLLLILSIIGCYGAKAQFLSQGKITYERKTSLRTQLQTEATGEESIWVKDNINKIAQYTISEFEMTFNKNATQYSFVKEQEVSGWKFDWGNVARENKVYANFEKNTIAAQKLAFENNYLEQQQLPRYEWKIMDEMRTIAGYPCRKAVTKICDSVVVVAFYCDQIMVSGGPESFNGLPGMILGLAIPRLYTTWFATMVNPLPVEVSRFKPAKKSREATKEEMLAEIKKATKDWGSESSRIAWWLSL
ncbi:MAG: GLPGLI family protein [Edaphocola sp.]